MLVKRATPTTLGSIAPSRDVMNVLLLPKGAETSQNCGNNMSGIWVGGELQDSDGAGLELHPLT